MFNASELNEHLQTSSTIKNQSLILAEWNLNISDNIAKIGNYRYRPADPGHAYYNIATTYDPTDFGREYTGTTNSDVIVDGGFDDNNEPIYFIQYDAKQKLYFSLEDCFGRFRPRSGINKLMYFAERYIPDVRLDMAKRPRYYLADKNAKFKYWSSYRKESGVDVGLSKLSGGQLYIADAAPFIVYRQSIFANRIIVKMQTHVAQADAEQITTYRKSDNTIIPDPFYGDANKRTPKNWAIQVLKGNTWTDALAMGEHSVPLDGYVEMSYGLNIPTEYASIFKKAEVLPSATLLPEQSINGYAYLVIENTDSLGTYHIWLDSINGYETFTPEYTWFITTDEVSINTPAVTNLTDPDKFIVNGTTYYREVDKIDGLRIVVKTMTRENSTFDLIELSPRLVADISDITKSYSIKKLASDLGVSGMPVGQLLASTGNIQIFDYDQAFNPNNTNSLVSNALTKNLQIKFFEKILDVNGNDYVVPQKTMYAEQFPQSSDASRTLSIDLRDAFFILEDMQAPQMIVPKVSLSYAVSMLMDSIGFSNYSFKRLPSEKDPTIPYFFVGPDTTVAKVINDLATATQTAVFFDEYNNLIFMSKNYMMPQPTDRVTDMTLRGSADAQKDGAWRNKPTSAYLASIIDIKSKDTQVYNDGKIIYTSRYIQKEVPSIGQALSLLKDKTWTYAPVFLWEIGAPENVRSVNDETSNQSSYALSAVPLNYNISATPPTSIRNQDGSYLITNNTIDLGEAVYTVPRHNGFFYANGEIIKFDAIEYNVPGFGNVWVTNIEEYQNYFSKLPFNGKIYPTGRIRIYAEIDASGNIVKHGRGQFGTTITQHSAGLDPNSDWAKNIAGCYMRGDYLFNADANDPMAQTATVGKMSSSQILATPTAAGKVVTSTITSDSKAAESSRNGIIKNFSSVSNISETDVMKKFAAEAGSMQSSALVMNGPAFNEPDVKPVNFVSYAYKALGDKYANFGTRLRIVGKVDGTGSNRVQTPIGSTNIVQAVAEDSSKSLAINGSSAGLAVMVNPTTNVGYYFELAALTESNVSSYTNSNQINNMYFYKVVPSSSGTTREAIPVTLWTKLGPILVDDGKFTGQSRVMGEENPTVYDIAIEYKDIDAKTRRFYLYFNDQIVGVVDDNDPLPIYNNIALFVRGSGRAMFENVYAIKSNYAENASAVVNTPIANSVFKTDDHKVTANQAFKKYSMSGIVQQAYLSGISPNTTPSNDLYFEEFGTILRECAYMNVRYDKAYPAFNSKIAKTFNDMKGYVVSGFVSNAYGAEFMIFNATDTILSLDSSSGNYLRILGVAFTQQSQHELSIDEFFSKKSDFSNPSFSGSKLTNVDYFNDYVDIKNSRTTYGKKSFTIDSPYIQTQDAANELMSWLTKKVTKPRKSIGLEIFSMPTLQLGDIVSLDMIVDGVNAVGSTDSRYVVYGIELSKSTEGPQTNIYISEVK